MLKYTETPASSLLSPDPWNGKNVFQNNSLLLCGGGGGGGGWGGLDIFKSLQSISLYAGMFVQFLLEEMHQIYM